MSYLKLIKLLYLVDREALLRWGVPVTTDRFVSMDNGPVVSGIYNLVREERPNSVWATLISAPLGEFEIELKKENPPSDRLSPAEEKLIDEVFARFGSMNRWDIRDMLHKYPEWKDPHGSSIPIRIRDILEAAGEDEEEIRAVLRELRGISSAEQALSGTC